MLAADLAQRLRAGDRTILTLGRCAASLATLPLVACHWTDAAIVYFDAHGDCNRPSGDIASDVSYLGGMVLTGAAGEWATGFGGGLNLVNVILVGARALDKAEQARVDAGQLRLVGNGANFAQRLRQAIGGRRVYIHLDCDVLTAGLVATEYQCADGLSFDDLHEAFAALAQCGVLGLEITEFEDCWPDGRPNRPAELLRAISPVLATFAA